MPKITVITPTNSPQFYEAAKKIILLQTLTDWEWIVLWNGGQFVPSDDARIQCVTTQFGLPNVGALKREACLYASAPYIVEFDHDDELDAGCLAAVLNVFETSDAAFVYSDDAHIQKDGKMQQYRADYGWVPKAEIFNGMMTPCYGRPEQLPQNVSRIWFSPDHVRAWRKDAYVAAGGHDASMKVCDDLDLMIRLYLTSGGKFHHIPRCLYKYNVHGENTWLKNAGEIQRLSAQLYEQNIHKMALVHWKKHGKRCIDLGGGIDSPDGWEKCDTHDADVICDLNERWPFEDNSVGVFRANDVIEHLRNPVHTMNEAHRCLVHGGLFLIEVPSTDGRGAFQDPSHVSFWNQNSAWYYTREKQQRYIRHLGAKARFQEIVNRTYFPGDWWRDNDIPYCKIHLAAIKDGPRLHGPIEI